MNKSVYIINLVLVTLLYVWIVSLYPFPNSYFLLYAVTSVIFLIVYGKRSRLSPFIPLFTFLYPFLYVITQVNNVAYIHNLITSEAYLSLVGLISGLLIVYKGNGNSGIIVNVIGIFIAYLYAMINIFIFIYPPNSPLPSYIIEAFFIDPLFITATFSTARALGYGIPRRKSGNYQNQPPQPTPQSNPQTPYQPINPSPNQPPQPTPQSNPQTPYQPINPSPPPPVIFIFRGLPPNCLPLIYVNGSKYYPSDYNRGDYILYYPFDCNWRASRVSCSNITYIPDRRSGNATVGTSVIITYRPIVQPQTSHQGTPWSSSQNLPQTPSKPLMGRSLSNWDPNVWINRTLSVYKIEKVIGEGGNGYVLKGEYSGKPLAIKVLKLYGGNPEEFFRDLATEASNLVNLSNHKNIVKIYAVNVDTFVIDGILKGRTDLYVKNPPMIVMEYMGGGTLKDLLDEDLFYYSSKWQRNVLRAICGVAEALGYIHSQGFVHMDVKPQNIFLSERPKDPSELNKVTFKLGDLGSAVRINGKVKQITPEYSPPEVFLEPARPYFDIYALGMTAYVLLTRKIDRPDLNEMKNATDCYIKRDTNCVRSEVENARMKLMYWNVNVDPKIDPLLKSMLSIESLRRPTAREVIDMIKKIDPTICS
ncbi:MULTISPECIES: protein kinase domain-containing protein [unclassified Stygiolobus]|uniref:protein kinase domain-containing protein n=1 Tax=unclassified Stygiolobus TaxID=2824672 RepID=UPI00307EA824